MGYSLEAMLEAEQEKECKMIGHKSYVEDIYCVYSAQTWYKI